LQEKLAAAETAQEKSHEQLVDLKKQVKKDQTTSTQKLKKAEQQCSEKETDLAKAVQSRDSFEIEVKRLK
jgi:hypothetical protein